MLTTEQTQQMLDLLETCGVDHVVMDSRASEFCWELNSDDSDQLAFHRGQCEPYYFHKLVVCDSSTTAKPVYKDWYMTVSYHS